LFVANAMNSAKIDGLVLEYGGRIVTIIAE
jgi:hypothetical protein